MHRPCTAAPTGKGFTLLEVLVALLILSIGLLGLAGMLSTGLHSNGGAYLRTQATLLAYDMADRMRANEVGVAAGDYASFDGTAPANPGCASTASQTAVNCTSAQMAQYDLYEWATELADRLPGGSGTITKEADGVTYDIDVKWNSVDNSGQPTTYSFQTSVRP